MAGFSASYSVRNKKLWKSSLKHTGKGPKISKKRHAVKLSVESTNKLQKMKKQNKG